MVSFGGMSLIIKHLALQSLEELVNLVQELDWVISTSQFMTRFLSPPEDLHFTAGSIQ
jgi:hypothetical protein